MTTATLAAAPTGPQTAPARHPEARDPGLVAVVGASGRSGAAFCQALQAAGMPFLPVVRDARRWAGTGIGVAPRVAELDDGAALARALAGADTVVSGAHARWSGPLIAAAPRHAAFVLMGSTRRFSQWPDAHGDGVRAGEAAFLASGRPGVMLHPTLIYGRSEQGDLQRLARLLARLPLAPLPGGGRALMQPIHQDDVTRCLMAAIGRHWAAPETLVIAGGTTLPYRDMVRAVARAAGLRPPRFLPLPVPAMRTLAGMARLVPGLPRIGAEEIRRLTENKAFDITAMRERLGVRPLGLEDGLALAFGDAGQAIAELSGARMSG